MSYKANAALKRSGKPNIFLLEDTQRIRVPSFKSTLRNQGPGGNHLPERIPLKGGPGSNQRSITPFSQVDIENKRSSTTATTQRTQRTNENINCRIVHPEHPYILQADNVPKSQNCWSSVHQLQRKHSQKILDCFNSQSNRQSVSVSSEFSGRNSPHRLLEEAELTSIDQEPNHAQPKLSLISSNQVRNTKRARSTIANVPQPESRDRNRQKIVSYYLIESNKENNSTIGNMEPVKSHSKTKSTSKTMTDEEIQKVLTRTNFLLSDENNGYKCRNPIFDKIKPRFLLRGPTEDVPMEKTHSYERTSGNNQLKGREFKDRRHPGLNQIANSERNNSKVKIEEVQSAVLISTKDSKTNRSYECQVETSASSRYNQNAEKLTAGTENSSSKPLEKSELALFTEQFSLAEERENDYLKHSGESTSRRTYFHDQSKEVFDDKTSRIRSKAPSLQEELDNFVAEENSCPFDADTVNYLIARERECAPNPDYLDRFQPYLNPRMRAILLDWMIEVSAEYGLKRETFHLSVTYIDRYLSLQPNVSRTDFQLVGATALFLASKIEEIYPPKITDITKSCDNGYTGAQIIAQENHMLHILKWSLNSPTLNSWANWYLSQWDLYLETIPTSMNSLLSNGTAKRLFFKRPCEESYSLFRELHQLIDCAVLDIQSLRYTQRGLLAAFMYLVLEKSCMQRTAKEVVEEFSRKDSSALKERSEFNKLFGEFLRFGFGFELKEMAPIILYAACFFRLPLKFDLPAAVKMNSHKAFEVRLIKKCFY